MDIRVFTCNNIQLRINSTDSCDTEIIICATSTKVIKLKFAKNGADCYSKNGDAVTVPTWQS